VVYFKIEQTVCTVAEEALAALRSRSGTVHNRLWRQITVQATPEAIKVHLGSVDEEGAEGRGTNVRENCRQCEFAWDDLADTEKLAAFVQFEPMVVANQVLALLRHLQVHSTAMRPALAM
jgi:hypothetical protein